MEELGDKNQFSVSKETVWKDKNCFSSMMLIESEREQILSVLEMTSSWVMPTILITILDHTSHE